jgi:hypothetical protein
MNSSSFNAAAFLRALGTLPAESPRPRLLLGIAALSADNGKAGGSNTAQPVPTAQAGLLGARLNRRYLRVRTVQDELGKLNFEKAKPGVALDDFVFEQTDFSMYKKIGEEEFSLFTAGLEDFDDSFYTGSFRMDRKKTGRVVNGAYKRIGGFYYIKQEQQLYNPLLMAVMRTLHTSLAFVPLVTPEELRAEFLAVVHYLTENKVVEKQTFLPAMESFNAVYSTLLELLDGAAVLHGDNMVTTFTVEPAKAAALARGESGPILKGVFHPRDKAYTMRLA